MRPSLDRRIQPLQNQLNIPKEVQWETINLGSNLPLHIINRGERDVVKLEFIFCAGSAVCDNPMMASAANSLITAGTPKLTSAQIFEEVDYYGGFLEVKATKDYGILTVYSLTKHLHNILAIIREALENNKVPEEEFKTHISNSKERFLVQSEKVKTLARRAFFPMVFGKDHVYGKSLNLESYNRLSLDELQLFINNYYKKGNCQLVVSGKVNEAVISAIENEFSNFNWPLEAKKPSKNGISLPNTREHFVRKKGAVQSAIRIGRQIIGQRHPDFFGLQVLNTVIGGYFGSRLMSNIREDKGYTYGIGSGCVAMKEGAYFYIATEVGVDVTQNALKEIYFEIDRLRNDKIPEHELKRVKSYKMGDFYRAIDGPFAQSEVVASLVTSGLPADYHTQYINSVLQATSETLQHLANKYLAKEDLLELVVGDA